MPKKQLLPPSGSANRREVSVNLRFNVEDHVRLKQVAEFSGTTVANLLFYVTINTTLPMMELEVQRASKSDGAVPSTLSDKQLPVPERQEKQP